MEKRDYYEILGIPRNATEKEIKQAYRRLAMELHPDRNPNDPSAEERFKEAAEAYDVLSNAEKRDLYNRFGHDGLSGQTGFSGVEDIFSHFGDIFSEFFGGDIFGGRRRSRTPRPARGSDLRYDLELTFKEAFQGTKKKIELTQLLKCEACDGIGTAPNTHPEACSTCGGHGQVVQRSGFMTLATTCPDCQGRGSWIPVPCPQCNGTGRAPHTRSVTATIPAGVDTGMRLRLAGEGEHPETGGEPGDLYIFINVHPENGFERDGYDLFCEVPLNYTQAILGHTHEVERVDEKIAVEFPPGTQPGDAVRIRDMGVPKVDRSGAGDLVALAKVKLPKTLTAEERDLLERLDRLQGDR